MPEESCSAFNAILVRIDDKALQMDSHRWRWYLSVWSHISNSLQHCCLRVCENNQHGIADVAVNVARRLGTRKEGNGANGVPDFLGALGSPFLERAQLGIDITFDDCPLGVPSIGNDALNFQRTAGSDWKLQ